MSLRREVRAGTAHGFPRVSGDEPQVATVLAAARPFSPRERG